MKTNNLNIKQSFNNFGKGIVRKYEKHVKPALNSGIEYSKELSNDVVDFAKKNPKKVGMIAAGTLFLSSAIALGAKLIKDMKDSKALNAIQSEHIGNQREIIDALREDIADKQEIIDTQHDAIDALHNSVNK